jgi:hypothetical protein
MALPVLSPEQRQEALAKAREARAARLVLLAAVKAAPSRSPMCWAAMMTSPAR